MPQKLDDLAAEFDRRADEAEKPVGQWLFARTQAMRSTEARVWREAAEAVRTAVMQ